MTRVFRDEPLRAIVAYVEAGVATGAAVELRVLDPDRGRGCYAGEQVDGFVHRPWRVWVDLAERLGLRLATPRVVDTLVHLRFEPLRRDAAPAAGEGTEKYGAASGFARVAKLEDPSFLIDLREALGRAHLGAAPRVLDLGVNTGDELELVYEVAPDAQVDHAASALAVARTRFPAATFLEADLAALGTLALGRFDLVLSIGTLQSAGLDDRALLRVLVQDHLAATGAVILGVPNCRYVDGEVQQHHRQVFVTGKHYVFVTGA